MTGSPAALHKGSSCASLCLAPLGAKAAALRRPRQLLRRPRLVGCPTKAARSLSLNAQTRSAACSLTCGGFAVDGRFNPTAEATVDGEAT